MATLVLTAVGTLVGGPIGGAIGAALGSQVDRALFTPKGARGPRLGSLAVQSSTYGAELPRLFGTMRAAGSVIWATDLLESRHKSGAKGQPKTTTYSYSTSFAVALSERPIRSVGRIWADGNLLRGADGDWKSELGHFRLHLGDEAQPVDPLIAAAEGIHATPAHRGLAYAVFEDLQLSDFGNRLPSLSFEIVADPEPVTLSAIAAELSGGAIAGAGGPALVGYAASGDSVRGAIEAVARALPVAFAEDGDGLRLVDEASDAAAIVADELGTRDGETRAPRIAIDRRSAGTLNEVVTVSYYDPARDWQAGQQAARRGAAGRRAGAIELPAAIAAADARGIAQAWLEREWAERTAATVTLPWRRLDLAAGSIVTLPGASGRWRVTRRRFEASAVTIEAVALPGGGGLPVPAEAGRAAAQADAVQGATRLVLLDLPSLGDTASDIPTLLIAAAGDGPGWRRATLIGSIDDGQSWETIGQTAAPAIMGVADTALPPGSSYLIDEASSVDVTLSHDGMALEGDTLLGWSATSNLAMIGDELVQFGEAVAIGAARYRLRRLLRGRRGSEAAASGHAAGEPFLLLDPDALVAWPLPARAIGARLRVAATSVGDAAPTEAAIGFVGRALAPPDPVALRASRGGSATMLRWTRRSRTGWAWVDGGDAPLGEQSERYRVVVTHDAASAAYETDKPGLALPDTALGTGPALATIVQLGTLAPSRPGATLGLPTGV
ncbi:phage tail protein [Sphingomonas sp.]|uniref:GTA baseplate fiber-binding domain-containing protein n=1 Tax=Sphingomonas sp. TaxID=28214 RepID=UPI003B00D076